MHNSSKTLPARFKDNLLFFRSIGLLQSALRERLQLIADVIRQEMGCAIATVNLVDEDGNWYKSFCDFTVRQSEDQFCPNALVADGFFIVEDARSDARFSRNPMVTGEEQIRFYAGLRLDSTDRKAIGTLCIMDNRPRILDAHEKKLLKAFARVLEIELDSSYMSVNNAHKVDGSGKTLNNLVDISIFEQLVIDEIRSENQTSTNTLIACRIYGLENVGFRHGGSIVGKVTEDIFRRFNDILSRISSLSACIDKNMIAAICYNHEDESAVIGQLETLQRSLHETYYYDEHEINIKLSVCSISSLSSFTNLEGVMAAVDQLLDTAHRKNTLMTYEDVQAEGVRKRIRVRETVKDALLGGSFSLHYQPKVSVENCELKSFEALLRWYNPELGGFVSPVDIINSIDELMLSNELVIWVLRRVIKDIKVWKKADLRPLPVSINLSFDQLKLRDFPVFVRNEIDSSGLSPDLFRFEIVEKSLITRDNFSQENMKLLNNFGIRFSIDDFGTDYSALKPLQFLPLSELKIDRSFIQGIEHDKKSSSLVHSIITIGHNSGLKVVAEGVETFNQFLVLRALGCDEIQGYYFSRPVPFSEASTLLASNRIFRVNPQAAA